ncbi:MAG: RHS repeat-associated core domain-containing protein, partial [Hafnia sp.]
MALLINKMLCHYRYDATDRLVGHLESEALERRLFYCRARQVTEMQGPSNRTNILHGELLLAQYSTENGKRSTALLTIDQQSSVINALQSQKPPSPISYTPYGYRTIGSDITSLPGFTGERSDPVTHHYSLGNGHRWFNPVLMRFNSPDSLSPFDRGGLNPYAYCLGDPVNRTDPSGQSPIFNILAAPTKSRITQFKNGVLTNVQPVNNVKQIAPGISIYDDTNKTGNRLNVVAHGQAPDPKNGIHSG